MKTYITKFGQIKKEFKIFGKVFGFDFYITYMGWWHKQLEKTTRADIEKVRLEKYPELAEFVGRVKAVRTLTYAGLKESAEYVRVIFPEHAKNGLVSIASKDYYELEKDE